jgi:hypothetical protein
MEGKGKILLNEHVAESLDWNPIHPKLMEVAYDLETKIRHACSVIPREMTSAEHSVGEENNQWVDHRSRLNEAIQHCGSWIESSLRFRSSDRDPSGSGSALEAAKSYAQQEGGFAYGGSDPRDRYLTRAFDVAWETSGIEYDRRVRKARGSSEVERELLEIESTVRRREKFLLAVSEIGLRKLRDAQQLTNAAPEFMKRLHAAYGPNSGQALLISGEYDELDPDQVADSLVAGTGTDVPPELRSHRSSPDGEASSGYGNRRRGTV